MAQVGRPRRAAEELLLRDGPLPRERVILEIQKNVLPGIAARTGSRHWTTPEHPCHGDPYETGAREVARRTLRNALRDGAFVEEAGYIRHRDWMPAPSFVVPTLDELQGMARLLTATPWEKAALVASHVALDQKPGPKDRGISRDLTPREFAAYGFVGLSDEQAVRRHVRAWESTGLPRPHPGEPVSQLPSIPFPRSDEHPPAVDQPRPEPRRHQGPPPAPSRSNDPSEWGAWWDAHKSVELLEEVLADVRGRQIKKRTRRRTRGGNVIQMERRNA